MHQVSEVMFLRLNRRKKKTIEEQKSETKQKVKRRSVGSDGNNSDTKTFAS